MPCTMSECARKISEMMAYLKKVSSATNLDPPSTMSDRSPYRLITDLMNFLEKVRDGTVQPSRDELDGLIYLREELNGAHSADRLPTREESKEVITHEG